MRALDLVIDRSDDLAHRIFGHIDIPVPVLLLGKSGQADSALSRVMCDGVAHQIDAALPGRLFHDGRFADAGRADEQERALPLDGNDIFSRLIL